MNRLNVVLMVMMTGMFAVVGAGCKSAEAKCNAAKVGAYDAWAKYADDATSAWGPATRARDACGSDPGAQPMTRRQAEAMQRLGVGAGSSSDFAELASAESESRAWEACSAAARVLEQRAAEASPRPGEITGIRDAARGGAIHMRDAVRAFRDGRAVSGPSSSAAAFAAADQHWEACQEVTP